MRDKIKKEVMRIFNQEASVDEVVQSIISIIETSKFTNLSDTFEKCECGMPKIHPFGAMCHREDCKGKEQFKINGQ